MSDEERAELEMYRTAVKRVHDAHWVAALETMANKPAPIVPTVIHAFGFVEFEGNVFAVETEDGHTPILREV